jgi:hypothetical protein
MRLKPDITDAASELTNQPFGWDGGEDRIVWPDTNTGNAPTRAEMDAKLVELQAEYDANQYQRDRQAEYPSVQELVVALYDTDDKSAIEAKRAEVKKKYPKPE